MKKLSLLTILFVFAFNVVCFAAVSGAKPRMSSPVRKPPTTQTAPNSSYKPSAPASSYTEKAPAVKPSTPHTASQPATGGFMRSLGMIGGGMLLGGLLGSMFGFGSTGMFATLIGILFNIVLVVGVFMTGRYLWHKFRKSQDKHHRN